MALFLYLQRLRLVLSYRLSLAGENAPLKLYPDKLASHLKRQAAPVYLLYGEEPFQLMQAGDQLRKHAKSSGFDEREVIHITDDSDWALFKESADSMSLFSDRRLIELRIPSGKPGRVGGEALKNYCENPAADVLLVISTGRLDGSATKSAWFKAIDKVGVTMGSWPIGGRDLMEWLETRLRSHGLDANREAIISIAKRVEGNLLAASQEVERLALLYPKGKLNDEQVLAAVTDSSRYTIKNLVDAALAGRATRGLHVLDGLKDEGVSPVLILWALNQEIRCAAQASEARDEGASVDKALKDAGVWSTRVAPLKNAMNRHDTHAWLKMVSKCSFLDRQIKGRESGEVWDSFSELCLLLSGVDTSSNYSLPKV